MMRLLLICAALWSRCAELGRAVWLAVGKAVGLSLGGLGGLEDLGVAYWSRRGVVCAYNLPLLGSVLDLLYRHKPTFQRYTDIYNAHPGQTVVLLWQSSRPELIVRDAELIHRICTTDFDYFHDRGMPGNEARNPLSAHLFSLEGERWKCFRKLLTNAFKFNDEYGLLGFLGELDAQLRHSASLGVAVDVKDLMERFVTDVIGFSAFGDDVGALRSGQASPCYEMCTQAFQPSKWRSMRQALLTFIPGIAANLPYRARLTKFFLDHLRALKDRRDPPPPGPKDILQHMVDGDVPDLLMASQMFAFYRAGFEATSVTIAFALLELAANLDVQEKLQAELDEVLPHSFSEQWLEQIERSKYLDYVLKETLRKYPPNAVLIRKTTKKYRVLDSEIVLPEGLKVVLPLHAIQNDPENYENPSKFEPERFTQDRRVPPTFIPFGAGRRRCVAQGMANKHSKVCLAAVVQRFKLFPSDKTPMPVPLMPGRGIVLQPKGGTFIHLCARE